MPYRLPTPAEKPHYVRTMFDRIATTYDRVNDLMTAGRHRAWKRLVIELTQARAGGRYLDVCTGTGDLAFLLANAAQESGEVHALDFSEGMLAGAKARPWEGLPIHWTQGDAEALPYADGSFDAVTNGFGLRNVTDLDQALREALRVLKPGGRFVALDLGKPRARFLRWGAEFYEFKMVPMLGGWVSGQKDAYHYLPHSNAVFLDQHALTQRLKAVGFVEAKSCERMWGAISIVAATAPRNS